MVLKRKWMKIQKCLTHVDMAAHAHSCGEKAEVDILNLSHHGSVVGLDQGGGRRPKLD